MAAYKCKMCGGDLLIEAGVSVCECEYCGTKQTVPNADNEKKLVQLSRAAKLLRECDFDRAAALFENVVVEFPEEAEAYWNLVLCRFGIEYVDDPATTKKVPTCHRSSFDSVMDDENFEKAMDYADAVARRVYREEAKAIEELRKSIIEVSGKEEPYDVFISYKETGDDGQRTMDSVIAQDIYDALTNKGYRVFFSRISLEDKLGTEYEPYIFAALNSAKVMLVVGTDYEHFNAVWVKNEWSRYLKLMASDRSKTLIPCYKDIDAYDMPKEFNKLTAQDMGKIGAMQDLLRGVGKILPKELKKEEPSSKKSDGSEEAQPLLKRMFKFLKDCEWDSAEEYAEKVLDVDPENAEAYLGKLMVEYELCQRTELKLLAKPLEYSDYWDELTEYGDKKLLAELNGYNESIKTRIYDRAVKVMNSSSDEDELRAAITDLTIIEDWKDSAAKAEQIRQKIYEANAERIYVQAVQMMTEAKSVSEYEAAIKLFREIAGWKDADKLAEVCLEKMGTLGMGLEEKRAQVKKTEGVLACNSACVVGVCTDGTVVAAGDCRVVEKVQSWKHIIAVGCTVKDVYGLTADGTVVTTGDYAETVKQWRNVEKLCCGSRTVAAICSDGSIKVCGDHSYVNRVENRWRQIESRTIDTKQCDVGDWEQIVSAACGTLHTVGLRSDGTVVATRFQCEVRDERGYSYPYFAEMDVSQWQDVAAVTCGYNFAAGLRTDGTVVSTERKHRKILNAWNRIVEIGSMWGGIVGLCDDGTVHICGEDGKSTKGVPDTIEGWCDIVSLKWSDKIAAGLRGDGTVVAIGKYTDVSCDVSAWSDVVAVACSDSNVYGLRSDGSLIAAGKNCDSLNSEGWRDITAIARDKEFAVGLRSDGTLISEPYNEEICSWRNVVSVSGMSDRYAKGITAICKDGTVVATHSDEAIQREIRTWTDIKAVACSSAHIVGLRRDGTLVAAGKNDKGQCNVETWHDIQTVICDGAKTAAISKSGKVFSSDEYPNGMSYLPKAVQIAYANNSLFVLHKNGTVSTTNKDYYGYTWSLLELATLKNVEEIFGGRHLVVKFKNGTVGVVVPRGESARAGDYDYLEQWSRVDTISGDYCLCTDDTVKQRSETICHDGAAIQRGLVLRKNGTVCGDVAKIGFAGQKLFDSIDDIEQSRKRLLAEGEQRAREREAREQEFLRRQEENKRKAEEARLARIAEIKEEISTLQAELPNLKGIFKAGKRKAAEEKLQALAQELSVLKDQNS